MQVAAKPQLLFSFQALSDPTRLRLLALLEHGEVCVGDLVAAVNLPQGTVSRHLRLLRDAGLVSCRRSGLWAFYELASEARPGRPLGRLIARAARQLEEFALDAARRKQLLLDGGCC